MQITAMLTGCRPPRQDWHVVPEGPYWILRHEGFQDVQGRYLTKMEAMSEGIEQARAGAVSLVLHGKNGRIQSVQSYDTWHGPNPED